MLADKIAARSSERLERLVEQIVAALEKD